MVTEEELFAAIEQAHEAAAMYAGTIVALTDAGLSKRAAEVILLRQLGCNVVFHSIPDQLDRD